MNDSGEVSSVFWARPWPHTLAPAQAALTGAQGQADQHDEVRDMAGKGVNLGQAAYRTDSASSSRYFWCPAPSSGPMAHTPPSHQGPATHLGHNPSLGSQQDTASHTRR